MLCIIHRSGALRALDPRSPRTASSALIALQGSSPMSTAPNVLLARLESLRMKARQLLGAKSVLAIRLPQPTALTVNPVHRSVLPMSAAPAASVTRGDTMFLKEQFFALNQISMSTPLTSLQIKWFAKSSLRERSVCLVQVAPHALMDLC